MIFKRVNIYYIIFLLLIVLFEHDQMVREATWQYDSSSSFAQFISLGMLGLTVVYLLSTKRNQENLNFIPLPSFRVLMISMYLLVLMWSITVKLPSVSFYITLILPLFILYFCYSIFQKSVDTKLLLGGAVVFLVVLCLTYLIYYQYLLFVRSQEQTVASISYYVLYLFPIVLCSNKKWLRVIASVAVIIVVLTSAKRGGALALIAGIFAFLLIELVLIKGRKNKPFRMALLLIVVAIVSYYLVARLQESDLLIVDRSVDLDYGGSGTGSGRLDIWSKVINMIEGSSFVNLLLGHGYNSVALTSSFHLSAHNDFLEIIYDYGIVVFVIYITFIIQLVRRLRIMIRQQSVYAAPMGFSIALFLVNSMVSHIFIYSTHLITFAFVWGGIFGLYVRERKGLVNS